MLNVKKLIASAEACLGWPYVSPGTNDARGIDCSGLFVKCYRDQDASIYHGSNTIYRKYCSEKGKLTSLSQLIPGMAVFKWNPNTPEKFNDDLGDFQHIGLVTSVNPLRIVHASTGTMSVTTDTKLGKWAYWGKLKDVEYNESPDQPVIPVDEPASPVADEPVTPVAEDPVIGYITADKVNFRTGPSINKPRIEYLNTGDTVEIIGQSGSWLKCKALGRTGYVKAEFVSRDVISPVQDEPSQDTTTPVEEPAKVFIFSANGGRVNIRQGNGPAYARITSVQPGTSLPYIATASNGWYAVKVRNLIGWVSPDFASLEGAVG